MATVTAVRKLDMTFSDMFDWDLDRLEDGLLTYVADNLKLKFTGDFTVFEFLNGTADTFRWIQDGKVQFKIEGLSFGNSEWAAFENGLDSTPGDALATLLSGKDKITGSDENDLFFGFNGADTMRGGRGNDFLDGGIGQDKIYGDRGNDDIEGDLGKDMIWGGKGNDVLDGDDGNDRIYGGKGNDYIEGDEDNDVMFGGRGADNFNFDFGDGENKIKDFGRGADRLEFDLLSSPGVQDSEDFVDAFTRKAGGNTYIEAEEFSVVLEGFTTTKAELATLIDLVFFDPF